MATMTKTADETDLQMMESIIRNILDILKQGVAPEAETHKTQPQLKPN